MNGAVLRYYFALEKNHAIELDAEGIELKSIGHARKYALLVLSEVLRSLLGSWFLRTKTGVACR
ncbi:hypothetical protein N7E02_07230 (plasmid) [Aliirhizobium terrae]|uniref:DUF6894 family protein n=1 Tax=Terrirhizobium terrae TaxID=2926709 RepID=UPI0025772C03|nr:hypothetical protein [Rhizobium sp. CC-CFT758]WJH38420.1 hypothetical protein N7E02_07230 [Rhizobium sp. CC-CFT758]